MKALQGINPQVAAKPVAITGATLLIVIALGTAGGRLLPRSVTPLSVEPQTERVSVLKTLKIQPPARMMRNASSGAGVPAAQSAQAPAQTQTQIARTAAIGLYVKDVEKAVAAVNDVARSRGGDVLSLDDHRASGTDERAEAQMELRIPDNRFADTMNAVSSSGIVRTQTISAEDLSSQIVDSSARLRNLRRTEGDILRIMDRSGSVGQILEAENQLSQVREQIETTDAEVKTMVNRVRYASLTVTLEAEVASGPTAPTGIAQLSTAWASATHSLAQFSLGILAALIWLAAFTPYILLGVLALWLLRRRLRAS